MSAGLTASERIRASRGLATIRQDHAAVFQVRVRANAFDNSSEIDPESLKRKEMTVDRAPRPLWPFPVILGAALGFAVVGGPLSIR